jgi:hypothetical protein
MMMMMMMRSNKERGIDVLVFAAFTKTHFGLNCRRRWLLSI